ncbi:MAG: FtsX-like permease family protein [Pseudomonadota bacterium]|nr:FtsX-like permease family protein [Pseudomonadota bacterium]
MNVWQRLAWLEWSRSVRLSGKDNHDFFWLIILFSLTLILALLLWGSREGLLTRLIDVSLGYIPQAGIPIWLTAQHSDGISRQLQQQLPFPLYPYREVEAFEIALPMNSWDADSTFRGWAVAADDPLWQLATSAHSSTTIPLDIILNEQLFTQKFNCQAYEKIIHQQLAFLPPLKQKRSTPLYCLKATNRLWLDVQVGTERREWLPFQIHWQSRIPTMEKLAFLFPLSTWHTLKLSTYFTQLRYYPEAQLTQSPRSRELIVWSDEPYSLTALQSCLGAGTVTGHRLRFAYPLPQRRVLTCLQHHQLPLKTATQEPPYALITEASESHYFDYKADYLTVRCPPTEPQCQPCETIFKASFWRDLEHTECGAEYTTVDMLALIGNYQNALTYVTDRTQLDDALATIMQLRTADNDPAFYLHPTYRDAHMRFLFLQQVVEMLKAVYSPFFLIFLSLLLIVQLGLVLTHRQHHYGILMAKGMAKRQLYYLFSSQLSFSFAVAGSLSIGLLELIRHGLGLKFANIVSHKSYSEHVSVSHFDLLPLTVFDYSIVIMIILGLSYLIAAIMFTVMIHRRTEPAYLFKF